MMTMIPVDYHTCFIAISPHAKILYANESMASLLGRKVTEISNKMSLPQLMTIPCQQLHQNFFKVSTQRLCLMHSPACNASIASTCGVSGPVKIIVSSILSRLCHMYTQDKVSPHLLSSVLLHTYFSAAAAAAATPTCRDETCQSCSSSAALSLTELNLQGQDTSKVAGLSCRSGRVVLAGDRNYNPVPITMILKEHEDDIRGLQLFVAC